MIGRWAFNATCQCGKVHNLRRHKGISAPRLTIKCECGAQVTVEPRLGSWRMPRVGVKGSA